MNFIKKMIEKNKKKKEEDKKVFTLRETILLVITTLLIGLVIGNLINNNESDNNTTDKYLDEFISNYNYILDNYYEDVDKEKIINGAISGMMESLDDPYSSYFDEQTTNNFNILLNGSYTGLGIQIAKVDDNILITGVIKNSPAEEAGLEAGDYIVSIDDKEAKDLSSSDLSTYVKESTNEEFKLKILRDTEEMDITIKKSKVTLESVSSEYYEKDNKKIGYIYIGIFANNTYSQFKNSLKELEEKNIDYLIIDVRGNSGGHLTTVDGIIDLFLNKKQKMYGLEKNNKKTYTYATGNESKKYKIVLLGDENSASASEVLIASLHDNLNSTFIGKTTYGKGTAQELVTLSDGTQYKITTQKWLTPKGKCVTDTKGITPDIEIDLDDKYYETLSIDDDTQLQKAFEYIIEN